MSGAAEPKNHTFLLDVMDRVMRKAEVWIHLLLVGDGPLRAKMEEKPDPRDCRAGDFLGSRDDVPA